MTWPDPSRKTLDCQACGNVIRVLTDAEAQQVADRPYNFIVFCRDHQDEPLREARANGYA